MVCKALASLDYMMLIQATSFHYFNPQGSREPRQEKFMLLYRYNYISIHKALASLDQFFVAFNLICNISIHKALASLDPYIPAVEPQEEISIHKALASLDRPGRKGTQRQKHFNPQGSREPRRGTVPRWNE